LGALHVELSGRQLLLVEVSDVGSGAEPVILLHVVGADDAGIGKERLLALAGSGMRRNLLMLGRRDSVGTG
jgi:hypothetical protein